MGPLIDPLFKEAIHRLTMPATVLSNSYRYQITQIFDSVSGLPVIGKRVIAGADGNASWAELLNEAQILHHLRGVQGCVQLVRLNKPERQLLVEDFGGVALNHSGLLGHVELTQFLLFAQRLSEAIACIHARGVTHKDINPANVLVRPESMQVQVIDFGLATTFSDERPEFEHQSKICGTLAYISPEQTGRMNRSVDYRTDLYALGCTLYHLATGSVPFTDTDPLTLIHAHLARAPQPPHELASWLPVAVSNLIMDLLIKEPDLRYQSAAGVATDFQLFTNFLSSGKPLALVQRKQNDRTISPRPPRRLYGRTTEIAALKNSFARVRLCCINTPTAGSLEP
jgi:serine/threonine protein kinase